MIYETNNNYSDLVDIRYLVRMDMLVIFTLLFVYIKSCATIECNKALSTTTYCEKPGYDKAEIPPNIPIVVEMSNSISVSIVQQDETSEKDIWLFIAIFQLTLRFC